MAEAINNSNIFNNHANVQVVHKMPGAIQFFLLTGEPGVGKTTLTKKLVDQLSIKTIQVSGFFTEEKRRNGVREGFDVVSINGLRGRLARDQSLLDGPVKHKVGKYGVLIQEFEAIALPCLNKPEDSKSLLVIDEIGKMELFSEPFKLKVGQLFGDKSGLTVLATIPARKGDKLVESIRNHTNGKVWTVTRENRNNIHEDILREMKKTLNFD